MSAPGWRLRLALGVEKGRPAWRTTVAQYDATAQRVRPATLTPVPILSLAVARETRNMRPGNMAHYMDILGRVLAPVRLP